MWPKENILLFSSLVTEAMNSISILNYFGVSNTRCIIGLINRTQLFPASLYHVVEFQGKQKSISQWFTHLSVVRRRVSALESHCLLPRQLFWDTTTSLCVPQRADICNWEKQIQSLFHPQQTFSSANSVREFILLTGFPQRCNFS